MTDSISEARSIKRETERELSRLLHSYEDSTGLPVSGIRMIRREATDELGNVKVFEYAVEMDCML